MYFLYFFIFIFGLAIGSFLNVVIFRLEKGESLGGRSYCSHCKKTLKWLDLIPVLSFVFLRGKCRYCGNKISIQYPVVELTTGLIFLLILNQFKIFEFANLFFFFYVASVLIVIFFYDLKHCIIPDKVLFPSIAIALLYRFLDFKNLDLNYILAALFASGFFLLIFLVSKGVWMGFGDVKLAILLGLILGFPGILVGLFLAFLFGAIIGLGLLMLKKKELKSQVPFAPFLIAGSFLAIFWGEKIISWYIGFL